MRKAFILAAALMGTGFGEEAYQRDLMDDTSEADDVEMVQKLTQYVPIAVEFFEIAEEFVMKKPEGVERGVYYDFGYWYADMMADNESTHPDKEECIECLINYIVAEFNEGDMTEERQNILRAKLNTAALNA